MHWIKEVEMVDSVNDLMYTSSMRGIQMPNYEVLDARIGSALNRIIHNSHFKRRISLGKSARMHIVRLMNNPAKGPKRMMTKVQWPC